MRIPIRPAMAHLPPEAKVNQSARAQAAVNHAATAAADIAVADEAVTAAVDATAAAIVVTNGIDRC